jgi:hypothetical protein
LTVWLRHTILLVWVASGCTIDRSDPLPGDTPAACTGCHAEHVADFATARHQRADDSDLFVALRARETPLRQRFCDTCHRPGPDLGCTAHGLGCDTCHRATGNRETANARLVVDRDGPLRAARPSGRAPHPSRAHAFVASAELCGTCHEVRGGGAFDEPVFTEWSASPAGRAGVSCADCHMPARSDGVARHDHAFVGPDHPRAGELLGHSTRVVIAAREGETVTVVVHNDNPAHSLPSGARFAREVWVTVEALDARGAVLPASGEAPRVDLGDVPVEASGLRVLPHAAVRSEHRAIGPASSARFTLRGLWPAGAVGLRARVYYRRNAAWLREALGLRPLDEAPHVLAEAVVR